MSKFIPSGYLSPHDALNRLGREIFGTEWTSEEHKARRGLMSKEKWLRIKDLPPARGGDAGIEARSGSGAVLQATAGPSDPSDPLYQEEYRARQRYTDAVGRLRQLLETGQLEAAILDPWSGKIHRAWTSLWRRHDADRIIESGQAPIPGSPNTGSLLVKRFPETIRVRKPLPPAKMKEAIKALKEKTATESMTRAQQAIFLRQRFSDHHITENQMRTIFHKVPTPRGRRKKSDKF